jgi:hypothetical protein
VHAVDRHSGPLGAAARPNARCSNTKSRLSLTPFRSMRRKSICSARAGRSVSPTRHSDTTASTPSGSDRSADVAEPDTLVVGMPGGYTQFVTAVAEVKPSDVILRMIAAASSMRSRVRIPGQPCSIRRQSAGTADAQYAAPSSPPAMAGMVSVSPPPRTAASSAWRRWSTRRTPSAGSPCGKGVVVIADHAACSAPPPTRCF